MAYMGDEGPRFLSIAITKNHTLLIKKQTTKTCGDPFCTALQEI